MIEAKYKAFYKRIADILTIKENGTNSMSETKKRKIVSSRHLATGKAWQASEFEYGLIIAYNGFNRWMHKCMAACGHPELNGLEILVVHHINHRESSKRLSDICFLLNIDDTHTVNYAIKKLLKADLVKGQKQGKEMFYSTTEKGQNVCERYREIREQCLLESITRVDGMDEELGEIANTLRTLSGMYDQASRAASSL